jgi:hypothetical protein
MPLNKTQGFRVLHRSFAEFQAAVANVCVLGSGHVHGRELIRGTYNAAQYLAERCRVMQAWSDYLVCDSSGMT